jgi:hypothetical protein
MALPIRDAVGLQWHARGARLLGTLWKHVKEGCGEVALRSYKAIDTGSGRNRAGQWLTWQYPWAPVMR